jgi:hypothetical protein
VCNKARTTFVACSISSINTSTTAEQQFHLTPTIFSAHSDLSSAFSWKKNHQAGAIIMPLDRKWLFTKENDIIVKRNRDHKKKNSPKKKKKKPPTTTTDDEGSVLTNHSSNTVVTSISARESKRANFLRSQLSLDKHRKFPAGAPVGHISRQLNAETGMNCNIDYNTTSQLFSLAVDKTKLLTFNSKKTQQVKNGTLPPIERNIQHEEERWDQRMYPTCELFEDMTPREGGYYPDNVKSKRKEVRHKPIVNKGFSIRTDVQNSVEGGYHEGRDVNDNLSTTLEATAGDQTYEKLVKQLAKKGGDLRLNDLAQISKIRNPHDYMNTFFRYIHILILGFDQSRLASRRDIVNSSGGEPDAKQTLLKECSPLLLYLQHVSSREREGGRSYTFYCFVIFLLCITCNREKGGTNAMHMSLFHVKKQINPMNIPLANSKLASRFFRAKILPMQPRELGRISTAFSKVVR